MDVWLEGNAAGIKLTNKTEKSICVYPKAVVIIKFQKNFQNRSQTIHQTERNKNLGYGEW